MKQPSFNVPFENTAGSYQPQQLQQADIASQMERENANYEQRLKLFEKSQLDNLAIQGKNAQMAVKDESKIYADLAAFSDKALEIWQQVEKQSKEDREIGETYDALFGEPPADGREPKPTPASQAEEEAITVG